jgi:hypothetical protein
MIEIINNKNAKCYTIIKILYEFGNISVNIARNISVNISGNIY